MSSLRHRSDSAPRRSRGAFVRRLAARALLMAPILVAGLVAAGGDAVATHHPLSKAGSPEVLLGDRLFFESRFSQYFKANCGADVNAPLPEGDPVVHDVRMPHGGGLPGPFRGQSMNCRQCHLGDDYPLQGRPFSARTYCDFSRRSAVPRRDDGQFQTARNAPIMIDLSLPREVPLLLHLDGEFATVEDLVIDTMLGRNFGWYFDEVPDAVRHIARVVREDDGRYPRHLVYADGRGIPYRVALRGTDPDIPERVRLPERFRIDVAEATDREILDAIAVLIHAYMDPLQFGKENTIRDVESPYDTFLEKNGLPKKPNAGESARDYAARLLALVEARSDLKWVGEGDQKFELHRQEYRFGPGELAGMKIFFATPTTAGEHVGNCVACHPPPLFTDFALHNSGASQVEYDSIFGDGAFAKLDIPDLAKRNGAHDQYLPATATHPKATGRFRAVPTHGQPGRADLGVWNIFENPDFPKPQAALRQILCDPRHGLVRDGCRAEEVLPRTIGVFKTPSVRDLGMSQPFLHSGAMDSVEAVLRFYRDVSDLARSGKLRNPDPELVGIRLASADLRLVEAFLDALNEDYQ